MAHSNTPQHSALERQENIWCSEMPVYDSERPMKKLQGLSRCSGLFYSPQLAWLLSFPHVLPVFSSFAELRREHFWVNVLMPRASFMWAVVEHFVISSHTVFSPIHRSTLSQGYAEMFLRNQPGGISPLLPFDISKWGWHAETQSKENSNLFWWSLLVPPLATCTVLIRHPANTSNDTSSCSIQK